MGPPRGGEGLGGTWTMVQKLSIFHIPIELLSRGPGLGCRRSSSSEQEPGRLSTANRQSEVRTGALTRHETRSPRSQIKE